ncbi:MAG TPA: hypothetical protein VD905_15685 [Flavobacteriales bacterium]|nr:hypothetical protein [Flavobacteriales bacterium]
MDQDELIDDPQEGKRPFNKSPLLYSLVTIVVAGFLMRKMHWPGASLFALLGCGISTGYLVGLIFFFRQHQFFENIVFVMYSAGITVFVINTYNSKGWAVYGVSLLITALLTWNFLKERDIS